MLECILLCVLSSFAQFIDIDAIAILGDAPNVGVDLAALY